MDNEYIIGISISIILTLIGYVYKELKARANKNTIDIEKLADKTDARLDNVEKDIVIIQTKIEK